jgi:hypothetical protein
MIGRFEVAVGIVLWFGVCLDAFRGVVLPWAVAPKWTLSGRFTLWCWRLWASAGRRIALPVLRLNFLSVYGPLVVMLLLALWGGLMVLAFALIYHGVGPQLQATSGPAGFGTLLYLSGSTFLTLGLGDVTMPDAAGRLFILLEAGSGFIFLALVITYMPVLHQGYTAREVGSLLLHSRAGRPPSALRLLVRYAGPDRAEVLRGNLREAELWMAETLESHVAHPVLAFYRAQRLGQSWLVSVATVLDSCALLIAGGEGLAASQARLTYQMGVWLLDDLRDALGVPVGRPYRPRLAEADLPALLGAAEDFGLGLRLGPDAGPELLQLVHGYDSQLVSLATWLEVALPPWIPSAPEGRESEAIDRRAIPET